MTANTSDKSFILKVSDAVGVSYTGDGVPGPQCWLSRTIIQEPCLQIFNQYTPVTQLNVGAFCACTVNGFSGRIVEIKKCKKGEPVVIINSATTNRKRKAKNPIPIPAPGQLLQNLQSRQWFQVLANGAQTVRLQPVLAGAPSEKVVSTSDEAAPTTTTAADEATAVEDTAVEAAAAAAASATAGAVAIAQQRARVERPAAAATESAASAVCGTATAPAAVRRSVSSAALTSKVVMADPKRHLQAFINHWTREENLPDITDAKLYDATELQFWLKHQQAIKRRKRVQRKKKKNKSANEFPTAHSVFPGTH